MSSIQDLYYGYLYSDAETSGGKIGDALVELAAGQPTTFIPNAVKAVAKGTDDTYRDQYSGESTGDQLLDAILASSPGLRQKLPAALDNFGQEKTYTGDPLLNILNASILPGALTTYKQGDVIREMERVFEATGDASFYPDNYNGSTFAHF